MVTTSDYLKLHFIVFLWGFTAVLGKLVTIPSVEMVFYRTLLAALGMGVLLLATRKNFIVTRADLLKLTATGFIIAIHWLTFFASGRVANASTSLVGFATCSLWAAFLEPILKHKRIKVIEVGLGLVVLAGLYIIFSFDFQYPTGLLLGIASGFTIALVGVINSKVVKRVDASVITFYEMAGACVAVLLFFPFYLRTWSSGATLELVPAPADWAYMAIMAWACSVYAYSVAINLSKRLSVFFIQLTLNLEPLYGIVLALLVFGEREVMGVNFYVGTLIILAAVVAFPLFKKKWDPGQSDPI
jgi:drug/metabolite transporter (DMT)-like permease